MERRPADKNLIRGTIAGFMRLRSVDITVFCKLIIVACSIHLFTGCAPSLRYTRYSDSDSNNSHKMIVPGNWDYRKNYTVPENKLTEVINSFMGTPYRYGCMSRSATDCSGFVCLVYGQVCHATLPHSTRKLKKLGKRTSLSSAKPGDLIFFRGSFGYIDHVGIYLGNGTFAHASSGKGVIYSNLDDKYYDSHFAEIRRLF